MTDKKVERRSFHAGWEIREAADGTVGLRGYAAMFDAPAHGEVVKSSAFTKTLAESADVRLLVNHDGVPLARTKSGTMTLTTDDRGLVVDVPSLDMENPTVQELVSALRRNDIDQMSFAFAPVRESYNADTKTRELLEVRLFDVSVVTYPWYDTTSVGLRDLEDALVELRNGSVSAHAREVIMGAMGEVEPESEDDATEESVEVEESLPDMLRELLAKVFSFYVSAHAAHWNVVGPDFTEYHDLFGDIYADVYGSVDPLAENIRKVGALAPTNLAVAEPSMVEPVTDARALAESLLAANDALIPEIVEAFDCATMCGEQGIANFLAERQDAHAKWSWQLSASLGLVPQRSASEAVESRMRNLEVARLYLRG